jgi:hypothetical protein
MRLDALSPRVWETWRDLGTLFLPGGADPSPWEQVPALPPVCATAGATPAASWWVGMETNYPVDPARL